MSRSASDPLGRSDKRVRSVGNPRWAVLNQSQSPAHQRMLEPTDNAACESWIATLKCERRYEANTADIAPWEVVSRH